MSRDHSESSEPKKLECDLPIRGAMILYIYSSSKYTKINNFNATLYEFICEQELEFILLV